MFTIIKTEKAPDIMIGDRRLGQLTSLMKGKIIKNFSQSEQKSYQITHSDWSISFIILIKNLTPLWTHSNHFTMGATVNFLDVSLDFFKISRIFF